MNTENLNGILAQYVQHCKARAAADEGTVWRAVDCFGVNWDIEDSDFPAMFADAMQQAAPEGIELALPTWPLEKPKESNYLREAMSWCIPNQGGNIDQAVALLNWWINSPEANEIIMAEPGVPASSEAAKAIEPGLSDIQKKIFTYINDVITPNCSPANPPAGAGSSEVTSLITDLEEKVYYGEITAEAAAQELFEEGNRIMSEAAAQ